MSRTYSVLVSAPLRGVHGSRTFCALIVIPRSRSMSMRSRYWARMLRPSTMPVTSSIRSASVDLPWSMWAMMQKFRMRAGSVLAGVVTVTPSSHAPASGTARPGGQRNDLGRSSHATSGHHGPVLDTVAAPATTTRPLRRLLRHPVSLAAACALLFALIVEATPVVGGDRAAQEWWRSWATTHQPPVDLGWYGGLPVTSYSLLSPWSSALLGLPLAGMLGTVVGA